MSHQLTWAVTSNLLLHSIAQKTLGIIASICPRLKCIVSNLITVQN